MKSAPDEELGLARPCFDRSDICICDFVVRELGHQLVEYFEERRIPLWAENRELSDEVEASRFHEEGETGSVGVPDVDHPVSPEVIQLEPCVVAEKLSDLPSQQSRFLGNLFRFFPNLGSPFVVGNSSFTP